MNGDFLNCDGPPSLEAVPLFPLPNVVLYPGALLPLHIFEERYKAMTVDALAGRRQIAMALLSPGWEKCYHGRPAIEPVVCLGSIVSYERLADGTFNFLLRGQLRASVDGEISSAASKMAGKLYRSARLTPIVETEVMEIDLSDERRRLEVILTEGWPARIPVARQIRSLLHGTIRTAGIADLLAFHLLDDIGLKQSLLADADVRRRVNRLLAALSTLAPPMADALLYENAGVSDPAQN